MSQKQRMKEKFKVVFFGTPEFAVPSLKSLIRNNYQVIACVTRPDKPRGRHLKFRFSPVKKLAQKHNLKILQPTKINSPDFLKELKEIKPALFVVVAFGKILPKKIIDLPMFGTLNLHASLLPRYRGASPIHYALLNGDKKTGVTIMKMDEHMDTGPVVSQLEIDIQKKDNLSTLHDKLAQEGAQLLVNTLPDYFSYNINLKKQDESQATYTKVLKKEDGRINWSKSAKKIESKVRAFNPWPGAFTYYQNNLIKIKEGQTTGQASSKKPGYLFYKKNKILVTTDTNLFEIKKIQLAGKKALTASEFINGQKEFDGVYLN
ncbi:MAG: methionyl-tRNA formyltransferase [Patescibacteria group bacterium]|nr:methionyl-tRNA formyltransferase [Patescibacteria group bacterium]